VDEGLLLLGDMTVRPRLADDDFERVRQLRLHRLMQLRDQPSASADRAFLERVYGAHPYGHLAVGSEETVQRITSGRVSDFHGQAYGAARATMIAAGDIDPATLREACARAFGDWEHGNGSFLPASVSDVPANGFKGLGILRRDGAAQSELRIGHIGVSRATSDFYALLVLNMALGGQFVSRVNLNLRERKGYTYGARTSFEFRRGPGPFLLQTAVQTNVTADAVREAVREIEDIRGARPITADELDVAKAALTRGYARNFETSDQMSRAALQLALHGLPDDYFDTFAERIEAVTIDDVVGAAERNLNPSRLATVIVGDSSVIAAPLEAEGFGPAVDLNL
jgi:zinc protease